jgi:hypothetical protein
VQRAVASRLQRRARRRLTLSVVELPGIEPAALPGLLPSELPVRSVSVRFVPVRYLRFRSQVLTASRVEGAVDPAVPALRRCPRESGTRSPHCPPELCDALQAPGTASLLPPRRPRPWRRREGGLGLNVFSLQPFGQQRLPVAEGLTGSVRGIGCAERRRCARAVHARLRAAGCGEDEAVKLARREGCCSVEG